MVESSTYHPQEQKKDSITMESAVSRNRAWVDSPLTTFCLAVTGIAYLLVIMSNGFIIVVNLSEWTKGRSLMSNNEIVFCLMLSNLCFSTVSIVDYFSSLIWKEFYSTFYYVQRILSTLYISTSFLSFWFTAWLSVFYCMKIVNFKQPLLLRMKSKFPGLVPWLLLGSALVSLGAGVLFQWAVTLSSYCIQGTDSANRTSSASPASNCTSNSASEKAILVHTRHFYNVLITFLGCSIPLTMVVFSSVPVLYSLFRHTHKLEQNLSPSHLEAHVKAAKAVLSLLLCYVTMAAYQITARMEIYHNWRFEYFLCLTLQLATILAQSTVLIRRNPRLNQTAAHLLSCLPGQCRKGNSPRSTAELQEV